METFKDSIFSMDNDIGIHIQYKYEDDVIWVNTDDDPNGIEYYIDEKSPMDHNIIEALRTYINKYKYNKEYKQFVFRKGYIELYHPTETYLIKDDIKLCRVFPNDKGINTAEVYRISQSNYKAILDFLYKYGIRDVKTTNEVRHKYLVGYKKLI